MITAHLFLAQHRTTLFVLTHELEQRHLKFQLKIYAKLTVVFNGYGAEHADGIS